MYRKPSSIEVASPQSSFHPRPPHSHVTYNDHPTPHVPAQPALPHKRLTRAATIALTETRPFVDPRRPFSGRPPKTLRPVPVLGKLKARRGLRGAFTGVRDRDVVSLARERLWRRSRAVSIVAVITVTCRSLHAL